MTDFGWLDAPAQPVFVRQGTPEWHAARKGKITASIAAACLGIGPKSRRSAWRTIKGTEVTQMNHHIRRGLTHEATGRRLYEGRQGVQVAEAGFVVHPTLPWLGASPDGLVGPVGMLEIKCPAKLPEELPAYHRIQCQIQLACTGRHWCDYLAFAGIGKIREWRVVRNFMEEFDLLMRLWEFWVKYVVANVEPPKKIRMPFVKEEA